MYPHRIRLRGPWECEPIQRSGPGEVPPARRVVLPGRWVEGGLAGFAGRVLFRRRFGYPGCIDEHERVWITIGGVEAVAEISLNGISVGRATAEDGPFEADVTELLHPRNELTVVVEGGVDGGLWGEVALEVRCRAFLRGVQIEPVVGALQIVGTVVGPVGLQLELYAVLGRRTADYAPVSATPEGTPFQMTAEIPGDASEDGPVALKLDLVNGASVWYTFEQVCAPPDGERPQS
jgi:hypothetical protein